MKRQEEMMQTLLRQFGQAGTAGAQIHGAGSEGLNRQADGVVQQGAAPNQQTTINLDGPRLGGTPPGNAGPIHGGIPDDAVQPDTNRSAGVRDEEYVPGFPRELGGQIRGSGQGL